ncbi:MAG: cation acetate symporter [Gammaproteobacteria bacterium]|nr:cation acetate symporter [Gammaproteobacteria bacterium]
MSQFAVNLIFIGLSFALYIGIALWSRAGSTKEFYVAGGGIHPITNGVAVAGDWMSAASFLSMAGMVAFMGYSGSAFLMGWTGGYILLAMLLAPYLRKFGKYTVPSFVEDRYQSKPARMIAVVSLLCISLTYMIGQMTGSGVVFARFLEVSVDAGIWIAAGITFFYAVLGGMKSVTYTQVAQYCVLIVAFLVPPIFISFQMTGNPVPQLGMISEVSGEGVHVLTKLNSILSDLGFAEYTAYAADPLNHFLLTATLMVGTAGLPHVIIRFFTVPKVADARWSAGWALVFIALLYLTAPAVASMARLNLMTTIYPEGTSGEQILALEESKHPEWMDNWIKAGLLKYEDKNGDGRIQYYNDASEKGKAVAEANGWAGNELTVNNDIMVIANPEIANLPGWTIGLMAAGAIAAALSTAAGLLMAISSAVSHDIVKVTLKPDLSEKGEMNVARVAMLATLGVSAYLGMNPPGFAAQTVALAFGLAASTLFPALMMGIFSQRINGKGAIAGMLAGITLTLVYIFMFKGWLFISGTANFPDTKEYWFFGVNPLGIGFFGAIVNFIVAYAVSLATEPPPQEIQDLVESVRYPKGAGAAIDH